MPNFNPQAPEYFQNPEYLNRLAKLQELRTAGVDPYPHRFAISHTLEQVRGQFSDQPLGDSQAAQEGTTIKAKIAGRLVLRRPMGKNTFAQIQEGGEQLQLMFAKDKTELTGYQPDVGGESHYRSLDKHLDLGDLIGVEGHLFFTLRGELTLFVYTVTLLAKALLPLPDKYSGLTDKELRYRKRWLDLISHGEVYRSFLVRSQLIRHVREHFHEHGFTEVETPVLQSIYGGASAKPFQTHLNALDQEMFLRISLEIPLKKLLVGGFTKVFEIGKVFRNEGIDKTHNPEFTELEAYAALWDYRDMMRFVEHLFETLCKNLHQSTNITVGEYQIEFKAPWRRWTMRQSILEVAQVDVDEMTDDQLRAHLLEKTAAGPEKSSALPRGLLINEIFEELVEPHLIQPTHILDHPVETTPLCKWHRDVQGRERGLVERFESFVAGQEICNAYSELNDPQVQKQHLLGQRALKEAGDDEAHPLDEEFIEALCQGMPPAGGIGIGIDRMIMLLTNTHSIRDVLFFPLMRSESES